VTKKVVGVFVRFRAPLHIGYSGDDVTTPDDPQYLSDMAT
jgi:hypothetical protein